MEKSFHKQPRMMAPSLILAISIGLLASIPFLKGIPTGGDTFLHFFRLVQLDALLQQGIFFSRWAPDLAYGYGYPIFNFYAPLTYYLAEIIHFAGLDLLGAFLATFVFAFVAAAVFMFLWVRDLYGDIAGLVAAATFALSPYLMVDSLQRGALAEHLALSLLPLILYAFRRLIVNGGWIYGLISTLAYACLLLTHNITALIFTPILVVYLIVLIRQSHRSAANVWSATLRSALPPFWFLMLGAGLVAFYWIPALFERELVQIIQSYGPSAFNYETNFQSLAASFSLPFIWDPRLINRDTPITLSLFSLILASIGVVGTFRFYQWGEQRIHVVFAITGVLLSIFMTLSLSQIIWNALPILAFVQFPWRFLGLATIFIAMLAGAGADSLIRLALGRPRLQSVIPATLIGLSVLYILPWQFADYPTSPPESTQRASVAYEREFGTIGTTSTGEYLPVNVKQLPITDSLGDLDEAGRMSQETLPQNAKILEATYTPLLYQLVIDSPESFFAVFNTFFFEGWRAYIDGQPTTVTFTEPNGLLEVEMPAGEHQLLVRFESTTVRDVATAISLISLAALVASLFVLARRPNREFKFKTTTILSPTSLQIGLILVVLLAMFVIKWLFLDQYDSPIRRSRLNGQAITGITKINHKNFDDKLILMGLDAPVQRQVDQPLEVTLFWQLANELGEDYSTSVVVVSENGDIVGQSDKQHPGVIPTSQWPIGKYAEDRHQISLTPSIPPGSYMIEVNVYRYNEPENRLNILDVNDAPIGQSLPAAPIELQRPKRPADPSQIEIETKSSVALGQGVDLIGYSLPETNMLAGQTLPVIFYWQADEDLHQDSFIKLDMSNDNGVSLLSATVPLVSGYPTSQWQSGDLWQGVHHFPLPASLPKGTYNLTLTTDTGEAINLSAINIDTPEHILEPPGMIYSQEVGFSKVAKLVGYDMPETIGIGEVLPVTLLWQSQGETPVSYKSFVQLLDDSGRLVVGSDAIPDEWQRPTTGWIADEYVTDAHHLIIPVDLKTGSYHILVGLYEVDSLERLTADSGEDAVFLSHMIEIIGN